VIFYLFWSIDSIVFGLEVAYNLHDTSFNLPKFIENFTISDWYDKLRLIFLLLPRLTILLVLHTHPSYSRRQKQNSKDRSQSIRDKMENYPYEAIMDKDKESYTIDNASSTNNFMRSTSQESSSSNEDGSHQDQNFLNSRDFSQDTFYSLKSSHSGSSYES